MTVVAVLKISLLSTIIEQKMYNILVLQTIHETTTFDNFNIPQRCQFLFPITPSFKTRSYHFYNSLKNSQTCTIQNNDHLIIIMSIIHSFDTVLGKNIPASSVAPGALTCKSSLVFVWISISPIPEFNRSTSYSLRKRKKKQKIYYHEKQ